MRAHQVMSFFVPEHRGHDDLLNAAALLVQGSPLGRLRTASGRRLGAAESEQLLSGHVQDRERRISRRS